VGEESAAELRSHFFRVLMEKTKELLVAVERLSEDTVPQTPMPHPRVFEIFPGVHWPLVDSHGWVEWRSVRLAERGYILELGRPYLIERLLDLTGGQPAKVRRCLRGMDAAIRWCEARREGRLRAAREILRQQEAALQEILAESILQSLADGSDGKA